MENYEIMFIVKPTLEEAAIKDTVNTLETVITNLKGKVEVKSMGKRELAYPIKKEISGFYYVFTVNASHDAIAEFDRVARINENVVRHLVLKMED